MSGPGFIWIACLDFLTRASRSLPLRTVTYCLRRPSDTRRRVQIGYNSHRVGVPTGDFLGNL